MTTGAPFSPTPLATTVVNPEAGTIFRRAPYISPAEFQTAPTAVATTNLIAGGTAQQNLQALADVIMRASSWLDEHCFHTADGTLAASPSTETAWIKPKPDGSLAIPCKYRPILELTGLAIGTVPSQLASLTTAPDAAFGIKTIYLPATPLGVVNGDTATWPIPTSYGGQVYAAWTYVNGFPHTALAASATAGASSVQVAPSVPGGSQVFGVYPGTQLTIHDGINTETIVVGSVAGTTLNLQPGTSLQHAHTMPAAPDSIRVSAVPWAVEQACISLTSCLIKLRGTRAAVMPAMPGTAPPKQALSESGGLGDYKAACELLRPFVTVFAGHN